VINRQLGITPGTSGFYFVRNNRKISAAQTLGFYRQHHRYSHFRAEVRYDGSLDSHMHTDVKKASVQPSQVILEVLRQICVPLVQESGRRNRERSNVTKGELDHSLAEQAIGQHAKRIPRPKRIVAQRSASRAASELNGSGQEEPKELPEVAQKRRLTGRKGALLKTTFEEGSYGKDAFYHVRLDGSQVTVCYNRDHPFYQVLHDYQSDPRTIAVLDQRVFAFANAELQLPEHAGPTKQIVDATLLGLWSEEDLAAV
jgi:hypothetical protein